MLHIKLAYRVSILVNQPDLVLQLLSCFILHFKKKATFSLRSLYFVALLLLAKLMQSKLTYLMYFFFLFRAVFAAHGGSQARGLIGAIAAGHSHSNAGSELRLRILNPLSEARDRTCNLILPSWICFCCTTMGTPNLLEILKTFFPMVLIQVSFINNIVFFFFF